MFGRDERKPCDNQPLLPQKKMWIVPVCNRLPTVSEESGPPPGVTMQPWKILKRRIHEIRAVRLEDRRRRESGARVKTPVEGSTLAKTAGPHDCSMHKRRCPWAEGAPARPAGTEGWLLALFLPVALGRMKCQARDIFKGGRSDQALQVLRCKRRFPRRGGRGQGQGGVRARPRQA